jgi:hypothetical protein
MFLSFAFFDFNCKIRRQPQNPIRFTSYDRVIIAVSDFDLNLVDEAIVHMFSEIIDSVLEYVSRYHWLRRI